MTLRWVPGWNGLTEPEAVSYVAAVEAADGEPLEFGVAKAINDFVLGCKNDGIWDAIKASCILAGARTLSGALVPLVGAAPTNYNFVAGDYDRETGLVGDGSTKYLDSNRNNNADPQDSHHMGGYSTITSGFPEAIMGAGAAATGSTQLGRSSISPGNMVFRSRSGSESGSVAFGIGLNAMSRSNSTQVQIKSGSNSATASSTSQTSFNGNVLVFGRADGSNIPGAFSSARLAFYSIGEALDLAALDTRVTRLMNLITYTQTAGLPDLSTMDMDAAAYIGGAYRAGGTLS